MKDKKISNPYWIVEYNRKITTKKINRFKNKQSILKINNEMQKR